MKENPKKLGTTLGFVALGLAAVTAGLWFRQVGAVALAEDRALFVVSYLTAFGLGVGAFLAGTRWFGAVPALIAIAIGGFFPFSVAISRQEVATTGIQVGETIPRFEALNRSGESFDSASLSGQPVLMKFFRGHW